jgi:CheY-like chemotaxis protein
MVTKGSVLVVDDEINLCRIIGAKLARIGYNVVSVHDGIQAVEKVRESDFDVVLLDLILPKMDGLKALAEIRSIRSSIPIIVMTACESAEALEQAKRYGVVAYVNKPFDLDNLVSLIAGTFRTNSSEQERKTSDSTVLFAVNQAVNIEVQNGSGSRVFTSRILDKDEHTLSVAAPCDERGPIHIPPKSAVKIGLAGRDAHYSFTTLVLRPESNPKSVLVIEKPSVIYRTQRREHPRFPLRIPIRYTLMQEGDPDQAVEINRDYACGETRNLSLGGALINVEAEIPIGQVLRIELRSASEEEKIDVVARVLRIDPADELNDSGFYLGCRFIIANPALQKLLRE